MQAKTNDGRLEGPRALDRRRFLAGAALTTGLAAGALACRSPGAAGGSPPGGDDFAWLESDLAELQEAMARGALSSTTLTAAYLERIGALDRGAVDLRAILETTPDALDVARARDAERAAGRVRGPLHGIPVVLKDNIATLDGTETTAGSLALVGAPPSREAPLVSRLRAAGAVILAKANLSEWANFRSRHSSSGWSSRGGQCRNPYVLDRNPCGSSSGSAVAASASLCAAAVGTETNGSIVCPASANGIVGLKPTVGLWSRSGIIPISESQDTAGPMTRTVRDAAILLGVAAAADPDDPATARVPAGGRHEDYTAFLDVANLRGLRLGVARQLFGFHPGVDGRMEEAIAALRDLGAEIVDPVEIATRRALGEPSFTVMLWEFRHGLDRWLQGLGPSAPVRSLAELIAWNREHAAETMPWFGQDLLETAQALDGIDRETYEAARAEALRLARTEGIDATMDAHRLDALVAPTGGPAWLTDPLNGDCFGGGSSSPAAVAGYPNLTVPAGFVRDLPVGVSFFGRAWSEPVLLQIAHVFEQATRHRRPPRFLPTLDRSA